MHRINQLLDDIRGIRRLPPPEADGTLIRQPPAQAENEQLREKLFVWFQQWIMIFERSPNPEKSFIPFITQVTKHNVLKVDEMASTFFRICGESSHISYLSALQKGDYDYAFHAWDATARLIVYIIKYHGDATGGNSERAKAYYLKKILSIFVVVLSNVHEEEGPAFHHKAFFRFFSSLINDLHSMETHLGPAYFHLLVGLRFACNITTSNYR